MREWLAQAKTKETDEEFRKAVLYGISQEATAFFEDDAPEKYGFERREGQLDMAYDILDALIQKRHIAVEAGVGIGKSFSFLFPLLLYSEAMNRPVVIATSTIALQEQLLSDTERLQDLLGVRREVVLAKGQAHYFCWERAGRYLKNADAQMFGEIMDGLLKGHAERRDFSVSVPDEVWEKVNVTRYGTRDCERCEKRCPYARIRERMRATRGIILCNQDILTAHLLRRKRRQEGLISPLVDVAVVDEAHNLESKVRAALTERLSYDSLYRTLKELPNAIPKEERPLVEPLIADTQKAGFAFFQRLYGQMRQHLEREQREMRDTERFSFEADAVSIALLYDLTKAVRSLSERVEILSANRRRETVSDASETLDDMGCTLKGLLVHLQRKVIWMERTDGGAELACCPTDIATAVRELYFKGKMRVILTSGTLTDAANGNLSQRYGYFIRNAGFPVGKDGVLAEPKPSPFPYDKRAMVYYCENLPHPTYEREDFIKKGAKRLVDILNISHGKALVLFTAKNDMEDVYDILQGENLPYKILKQGDAPSQAALIRDFETDTDSVLLGTGAYWEGVSVEGKSLSNLVIFRLPFPTPDPVMESKALSAADPLMDVQVPEMIIKLKQGIGRLIRNFTDSGIISVIDPRLRDAPPSRYHDTVWDALPVKNRTNSLRELRNFYKSLQK